MQIENEGGTRIKTLYSSLVLAPLLAFLFTACSSTGEAVYQEQDERIQIVATLFPQYDFAKIIAGERAAVTMLIPPDTESHAFDPGIGDMLMLNQADLFIYTGDEMEPWAKTLAANLDNAVILDLTEGVTLKQSLHSENEDHEEHSGHEHEHEFDPHIWLDLTMAADMVDAITSSLCALDPDGAAVYRENAAAYKDALMELDQEIWDVVKHSERKKIVFGGSFGYLYFLERYDLAYETVYDTCSVEVEPSIQKVAHIIQIIQDESIPVIFHEELANPKVAKAIAGECGIEYLLFSTAHNVTKSQFDEGITFLDIMNMNLEHLKKGLS